MSGETVEQLLSEWLGRYGAEQVRLGELLCDSHRGSAAPALVFEGSAGAELELSYEELGDRSARLAGALAAEGVEPGDAVAVMLRRSPETLVSALAIWRLGAVHVPLFTAFGPDAVDYRIRHCGARWAIVDAANRDKVGAERVVVASGDGRGGRPGDLDLDEAIERGDAFEGVFRDGDDLLMLLCTSGTTGQPKAVEVPVRALASIRSYMQFGLDLREDDVFWNIADPAWGYGLWFGVIGPLLMGRTTLLRDVPFNPGDVYSALLRHGVTNFTGPPTMYRGLRAERPPRDFRERHRLRALSSVGEPLGGDLLEWSALELGLSIHDHYGQSEIGMVCGFAHQPSLRREPEPGSMGTPMPGYRLAVLDGAGEGVDPGEEGELAVDVAASPLYWFRGYLRESEKTAERFPHGPGFYVTGDEVCATGDGLLHFRSRLDDLIKSSAYRVGPFEVESALLAHDAVFEVAVVGTPDEIRGEAVTAFVVPSADRVSGPELADELRAFVRARLGKHLLPRRVVFVEGLPRNPSGKVKRSDLQARWQETHAGLG